MCYFPDMGTMTRPWPGIAAHYARFSAARRSFLALASLAQWISSGPLSKGLFAWTSVNTLCITQTEVTYPYDGPRLTLSPISENEIELRYVDTPDQNKQWHRTVDAAEVAPRILKFLDELRWFPRDVLGSLRLPDSSQR